MPGLLDNAKKAVITQVVEIFMDKWLTFATDFFGPLTKTRWGTKALLAMLIVGGAGYLTYLEKMPGEWCAGVFIAVFIAYAIFRGAQEKRENGETK